MKNNKNQKPATLARKKSQRGAALVETALVFTAALAMIVIIVDMGRILLTQQYVSQRAQAAARSAVVNNWDQAAVQNYLVYGSTAAPDGGGAGLMGLTTSQVAFNTVADTGIGDGRYQVVVSGVPMFTWIPYMAGKYYAPTVTATAPVQSQGAIN